MRTKTMVVVVGIIVALGLIATTVAVYAQAAPGGFQGGGGGAGARGGGAPGGRGGDMGRMMMMMRGGQAAIAVSDDSVYVVYMGTLFKFNADTLEEEGQAKLEVQGMAEMMQRMGGGRGGPGGAPAAGGRVNDGTPPPG